MASLRKLERRLLRWQRYRNRMPTDGALGPMVHRALWAVFVAVEEERVKRGRPAFWNGRHWTRARRSS